MRRLLSVLIVLCITGSASAELVNRYSFTGSGSTLIDSVGDKDGTAMAGADQSQGQLILNGTTSSYAQLPGDVLDDYSSASVEAWFTLNASSGWLRIFDFGDTSGSDGGYYWFYSPSGGNSSRLVISTGGFPGWQGEQLVSAPILPTNRQIHIVCVYDEHAGQMRIYQDGREVAADAVTMQLTDVRRQLAYLGRSVYPGDPRLNGAIDEFRVYNAPLDELSAMLNYQLGPDNYHRCVLESMSPSDEEADFGPFELSWSVRDGVEVDYYQLYITTQAQLLDPAIDQPEISAAYTGSDSQYLADDLSPMTDYYWRVDTVTTAGQRYPGPRFALSTLQDGGVIDMHDEVQHHNAMRNTVVNMTGKSELHLTAQSSPIVGCTINLNSPDSWVFFRHIQPSRVNSTFRHQIRVNGQAAQLDNNIRIVQHVNGSVVIPHGPDFEPLEVYSDVNFTGTAMPMGLYTYYRPSQLGQMNNAIRSFRLKRGYMATFAQQADGTGISKVYIAADEDLDIGMMLPELDSSVSFVRVFPWRWANKKGWSGGGTHEASMVDSSWRYDWDNAHDSTLNMEYVPMRHNRHWNAYSNINNKQDVTHVLGFNEPDRPDQADMSVDEAIDQWPRLLESGLRLGSPAPSDAAAGIDWLYEFMDRADELNYRVDFVAVHYYKGGWSAQQKYNWLRGIYERTGRPLWITEWNNGANWTPPDPTFEQNAQAIQEFINMMNDAPFVERYSIYQWVGETRHMILDGQLTPAGYVYRDTDAPDAITRNPNERYVGYWPLSQTSGTEAPDLSGMAHDATLQNGLSFDEHSTMGPAGRALRFDGTDKHIELGQGFDEFDKGFSATFWANPTQAAGSARFIDLGNGQGQDNIAIGRAGTTNDLIVQAYNGTSAGPTVRATGALESGTWQFFAVTINERGNVRIYKNGRLIHTGNTAAPTSVMRQRNYIGKSNWASHAHYHGLLTDVRMFNHALDSEQVETIFHLAGQAGNRMVHHWRLDDSANWETAGGRSISRIVDSASGTTNSFISTEPTASGRANVWFAEPGATENTGNSIALRRRERIELGSVAPQGGDFTLGFWFQLMHFRATEDDRVVLMSTEAGQPGQWAFDVWADQQHLDDNDGKPALRFSHEPMGQIMLDSAVEIDRWYHLVMTRGTAGQFNIYLDQQLVYSGTNTAEFTNAGNGAGVWMAMSPLERSAMVGALDDIRIYNYAVDEMPDLTYDGSVDVDDLEVMAQYWLQSGCGFCGGADLNLDSKVDMADFAILARHWLTELGQ